MRHKAEFAGARVRVPREGNDRAVARAFDRGGARAQPAGLLLPPAVRAFLATVRHTTAGIGPRRCVERCFPDRDEERR